MQTRTRQPDIVEIETWIIAELATSRCTTAEAVQTEIAADDVIDSLEGVEIAISAEVTFGVRIEDRELPAISGSVRKLAGLIAGKVGVASARRGGIK